MFSESLCNGGRRGGEREGKGGEGDEEREGERDEGEGGGEDMEE